MPEHSEPLPPGAVRRILRYFKLPQAFPPWSVLALSLLWRLAEASHTAEFILLTVMSVHLGPEVLFLVGAIWLGLVVHRAASRPDAAKREREMHRMGDTLRNVVKKFEALLDAHDLSLAREEMVKEALRSFKAALNSHAVAVMATIPPEHRPEYFGVLLNTWADLSEFHSSHQFSIEMVRDVIKAVDDAEVARLEKPKNIIPAGP